MREGCYVGYEMTAMSKVPGRDPLVAVPRVLFIYTVSLKESHSRCSTESFVYLHCVAERKPQSFNWTLTSIIKRRKAGTSKRTPGYAGRRLGLGAADQIPLTPTSYGPSIRAQRTGSFRSVLRVLLP